MLLSTVFVATDSAAAEDGDGGASEDETKKITKPSAPTLTSATPGDGKVRLEWTAPNDDGGSRITKYKIYRSTISGWEFFHTSVGNVLNYTDSGLFNGWTYYYKVSAVNRAGEGPKSNELSATPADVPNAPTLTSAKAGDARVTLVWSAPADDDESKILAYRVYRGTSSGEESLLIELGNVLTYEDGGLANGQTYFYRVSAVNSAGEGPKSNEASATPAGLPLAPRNLVAEASDAKVVLTWSAPAGNGGSTITGYRVYRGTTSGGETLLTGIGNVLTFIDVELENGQTYHYQVSAVNAIGEGARSNEATATPATIPSVPRSLSASGGIEQAVLAWQAPESDGGSVIIGFEVFRGTTSGEEDATPIGSTNGTTLTYTNSGLEAGTYYYVVRAVNAIGESGPSNEAAATVIEEPLGPPTAPEDLEAEPGASKVTLTWCPPVSDGGSFITGYKVYRKLGNETPTLLQTVGASTLSYQDSTGKVGTTYLYYVRATNALGEGAASSQVSAAPQSDGTTLTVGIGAATLATVSALGYVMWRRRM